MKIGIISYPSYGGSGALATELGKHLAKKGHQVHMISYEVPFRLIGSWQKNISFHQVEMADYPLFRDIPYSIALTNKIAEVANQEKLEILHAHYAMPNAIAMNSAKKMIKNKRIKTVTTLHGTDVTVVGKEAAINETLSYALKESNAVTTVSKSLADEAKENFKIKKRIKVIYNFVNTKKTPRRDLKDLTKIFTTNDEKILIHVSNFRAVKRAPDVVKIFAVVNKDINCKLILVGDGPEKGAVRRLVANMNLQDKIHFLGMQSDVDKLLSISDLFLLPSEKEGFNLSALEAMSCGVPVITTLVNGMKEMIKENKCGLLSKIGDTKKMASDSIELLANTKLHEEFAKNGMKAVEEKYRPEIIVPEYEKLYKQLLKKKR